MEGLVRGGKAFSGVAACAAAGASVTNGIYIFLQLCDLYENDCIFDKFDCSISGDGKHFCTGTYSNFFRWGRPLLEAQLNGSLVS